MYRLHEFKCPFCLKQEEYLVELDEEGLPVAPLCYCEEHPRMERVFTPVRAQFAAGFFSHDRPRRIEISYQDQDGKTHRQDVTHKVDLNNAPGTFDTKDD